MARRLGAGGLLALSLLVSVVVLPAGASDERPIGAAAAQIELTAQTPVVPTGGTFAMRVRLDGVPDDGSIHVVVHQRVRSRSELAASMEGTGLRSRILDTVIVLTTLPAQADGTRVVSVSLDPAGGGLALRTEGVYPVELTAQTPAGEPLASLVTHLIVAPEPDDEAPSLGVAVVAQVGAPPALQPDGTLELSRSDATAMAEVVAGLVAAPNVPVTLAATPETLDALRASAEPGDVELVAALRSSTVGQPVLALPYVQVSPDQLARAGLLEELGEQLDRGRRVTLDALGVEPTSSVGMMPPQLGAVGLSLLAVRGQQKIVVADTQLEPLDPGIISYSVAQPFLVTGPDDGSSATQTPEIEVLSTDAVVLERLASGGSPGLVASRVLSEIAFLRLEQPSVPRSVVLPIGPGVPATVVQLVLQGLSAGRPFQPMSLEQAFEHADPLLDGGGNQVVRHLLAAPTTTIPSSTSEAIIEARSHFRSFQGLVGADSPAGDPLERHLLVASASAMAGSERRAHIDVVESAIDALTSTVTTPATFTLTLTARDGTIPLTISNASGMPLHVSLRLSSRKLEFPDGDRVDLVLTEPSTRIDIAVRARATGAFPLEIDVVTPDGQRRLAVTRYTVRSTAVSGAGLILSVGAGLFLVVWWAKHWHRTRRSAKLVAALEHPAATGG